MFVLEYEQFINIFILTRWAVRHISHATTEAYQGVDVDTIVHQTNYFIIKPVSNGIQCDLY